MLEKEQIDVGVIVGRFQVDDLHDGHRDLINSVYNRVGRLIIFVGLSPNKCTAKNPLDFATIKSMLEDYYPDATIQYIKDTKTDAQWSINLDDQIEDLIGPNQTVKLFGSRDSFIPYYHGKFETEELIQRVFVSGTQRRKELALKSRNTADFRAGAIWAMQNQWPEPDMTIDSAIFNDDYSMILLGRKPKEDSYRLIGGFVGVNETLEYTVIRETKEEAGVEITDITYITSQVVPDWRRRGELNNILTALFASKIAKGSPKPEPGDDICELRWFDVTPELINEVVEEHVDLIKALLSFDITELIKKV